MSKIKKTYKIKGMDCASCASLIEMDLEDAGIKANCSYPREILEVEFDPTETKEKQIEELVKKAGYSIS
ncbi:MAG: cation transporter [Patescibacteria group bacterium]